MNPCHYFLCNESLPDSCNKKWLRELNFTWTCTSKGRERVSSFVSFQKEELWTGRLVLILVKSNLISLEFYKNCRRISSVYEGIFENEILQLGVKWVYCKLTGSVNQFDHPSVLKIALSVSVSLVYMQIISKSVFIDEISDRGCSRIKTKCPNYWELVFSLNICWYLNPTLSLFWENPTPKWVLHI